MRELMLLLVLLVSIQVHALASAKANKMKLASPDQKMQTTEDPGSATRLLYVDPQNKNAPSPDGVDGKPAKAIIKQACTDNMGMIYTQNAVGYEGCVRSFSKEQPKLPGDNKRPNSLGFTIGN